MELTAQSSTEDILSALEASADPARLAEMKRVGIKTDTAIGLSNPELRQIAKAVGVNHARAAALWQSPVRESKMLALLTFDPGELTQENMLALAGDFVSWEMVDLAADLFVEARFDAEIVSLFAQDDREFVRRTAFAMIAGAAVHRKKEPDGSFMALFPLIEAHAADGRNFVKKAVSWALRNVGMRNVRCHRAAIALAEKLAASDERAKAWVGRDALRYLADPKRIARLKA
ncbi:DNA alkylation repair protein [Martelella lutilitoris]|uniref:DNA alkylation repair protein n=1 Tax=Martelella lutilitoris TaxID=2583532 RepID=A0A5C4JW39_9HYPH|nr:DNA alkylation repair protein [Martelella lutilitoris]TNB49522.1 DNA alkylation repair protein [Martelella lutilitoris]